MRGFRAARARQGTIGNTSPEKPCENQLSSGGGEVLPVHRSATWRWDSPPAIRSAAIASRRARAAGVMAIAWGGAGRWRTNTRESPCIGNCSDSRAMWSSTTLMTRRLTATWP